jgi:hypothetical protein
VNTHPNFSFVVGYVSRFLEEPLEDQLTAMKWILHYVVGSNNCGSDLVERRKIRRC